MAAKQRKTPGPELGAYEAFHAADERVKALRKQMDAIKADDKLTAVQKEARVKKLEEQELTQMLQARRALERHRARAERREPSERFQHGGLI
jgi:hypothetical protein